MRFDSDTHWMNPIADPASFVLDGAQRAELSHALRRARQIEAMIGVLVEGEAGKPDAAGWRQEAHATEPRFAA